MNLTDIIFQTVSNFTAGLVTDVQTAVVGLVTIGFIVMGLSLIKNLLLSGSESSIEYEKGESEKEEKKLFSESREAKKGSV